MFLHTLPGDNRGPSDAGRGAPAETAVCAFRQHLPVPAVRKPARASSPALPLQLQFLLVPGRAPARKGGASQPESRGEKPAALADPPVQAKHPALHSIQIAVSTCQHQRRHFLAARIVDVRRAHERPPKT